MPVKPDRWIIEMATTREMIKPFAKEQVRRGISFGVSSYGYDISLSDEFKVFSAEGVTELDPKQNNEACFQDIKAESVIIPPNSFILARTREYFKIPRDIITIDPPLLLQPGPDNRFTPSFERYSIPTAHKYTIRNTSMPVLNSFSRWVETHPES